MTAPSLAASCDRAFAGFVTAMSERAGGEAIEANDLLLWAGRDACPHIVNGAIPLRPPADPRAQVAHVREFFRRRGHGFGLHVREHADTGLAAAAADAGLTPSIELEVMACGRRPPDREPPTDAEIAVVGDRAGVGEFAAIAVKAFGPEIGPAVCSTFRDPRSVLAPDTFAVVARDRRRSEPVSGALVHVSRGVACVGWVGTRHDSRCRGFAELVTRHVTARAFGMGARLVTLQASPMGVRVYERVGFSAVSRYRVYTEEAR